ncbi:MAG: DUF3857 and transglutaminase domain-containing protein [Bacteroidota bacterium]
MVATPALAQKPPIKWNDIPDEHLAMREFPADTNASAVILADFGEAEVLRDWSMRYTRHRRVKLLDEGGYDWGTVRIAYYAKNGQQRVRRIKAHTVIQDEYGRVTRSKVDKGSIFEEDIDQDGDWKRVRFTLPNLQPGAVIEYTYVIESKSARYLPNWSFQRDEPTLLSEYRMTSPDALYYVTSSRGMAALAEHTSEAFIDTNNLPATSHRYIMRDVPALREEPFMTTPDDYRSRIEFQLASLRFPDGRYEKILDSWETLAEGLHETSRFKQQLRPSRSIRRLTEQVIAGVETSQAKMEALYDHIRTAYTWDETLGIFPGQDLDDVVRTQSGSSGDLVGLLIAMARAAELDAFPVLISTRQHGQVVEVYPLLSQFNDVLAYVGVSDEEGFLLSPTDPHRPYTLPPTRALGTRGWAVLNDQEFTWLDVSTMAPYAQRATVTATLSEDGTLSGTVMTRSDLYKALASRAALAEAEDEQAFVRSDVFGGAEGLLIDEVTLTGADEDTAPLTTSTAFSQPGYALAAGDMLYVNLKVIERLTENPLKAAERAFPVDLTYPRDFTYTISLTVPEGYEVVEQPEDLRLGLSEGGLFLRQTQQMNNTLMVQSRFVLGRAVFGPEQYNELRELYARVVAADAEQVVLRRTGASLGTLED